MADDKFFDEVMSRPFIINAARGGVTSNNSLKKAIKSGKISGAVIDCWENEPDIDRELLELVDIATTHIAGYSADGKWTATRMSIENLIDFFNLKVNPNYLKIPHPLETVIDLQGILEEDQLSHAVWHTYNPIKESELLNLNPDKFYWFRSNYPLRREYHAYSIVNATNYTKEILKNLGFNF